MIQAKYDWTSKTPSIAVIEMIAIAIDREPTGIGPLFDVIDPDALDALVQSNGADPFGDDTAVTFEFLGQSVTVHGDGAVVVRPGDPRSGGD